MAKVHTSNKRPRIEDSTRPKATPEFYQDFPEVSSIGVTTLIKSRLPLTFMEWPDYIQSGLVVNVLPLMRDTPDPEARALITRYWEVRGLDGATLLDAVNGPSIKEAHQRKTIQSLSHKRVSRAIKSWETLMAKMAGHSDTILVRRSLAIFLLDCLIFFRFKCLGSPQSQLGMSESMLIFPGPNTSGFQQVPVLPQLIESTIAFLGGTAQQSLASYKPIPKPTTGTSPTLPIPTPPSHTIACNSSGTLSADVCANMITPSGTRSSYEEGSKDFARMVKACIVPRPNGANFLNRMACNSHVKKAAYHLFELPKLLCGSKVNWQHSGPCGILLHGPPGTGKTSLAEAMAFDAQYTFFKVPASLIRSCLVGNSEKIARAMFDVAEAMSPSIIFIDEFDHLGSDRETTGGEKSKELKAEFLAAWSECNDKGAQVMVFGATNLPWTLDEAIVSRFTKVLHIPLPSQGDRKVMLQKFFSSHWHRIEGHDWQRLSRLLAGMSGRDMVNIVRQVITNIAEHMVEAKAFGKQYISTLNESLWVPCALGKDGNGTERPYTSMKPSEVHPKQITAADVAAAIKEVGSMSAASGGVRRHEEFALRYGKGNQRE